MRQWEKQTSFFCLLSTCLPCVWPSSPLPPPPPPSFLFFLHCGNVFPPSACQSSQRGAERRRFVDVPLLPICCAACFETRPPSAHLLRSCVTLGNIPQQGQSTFILVLVMDIETLGGINEQSAAGRRGGSCPAALSLDLTLSLSLYLGLPLFTVGGFNSSTQEATSEPQNIHKCFEPHESKQK